MDAIEKLRDLDHGLSDSQRLKIADIIEEQRERLIQFANAFDVGYAAAERALAERAGGGGRQDAIDFLYRHGALTHVAAREAVELLTSNGFEISRRSK